MDTLTVKGLPARMVSEMIAETERKHPRLKQENDRLRQQRDAILAAGATPDQIDAALVSTCRSDTLNCGRCYLHRFLR